MLSPDDDPTDEVAITVSIVSNDTVVPASIAKFIHAPRPKIALRPPSDNPRGTPNVERPLTSTDNSDNARPSSVA